MKVTFFGTRGSVPVSGPDKVRTGGNTTCLRIESSCLPPKTSLAIDAGSGFIPFSAQAIYEDAIKAVDVLFTHWHYDHIQGLLLSPLLYRSDIPLTIWGPVEHGYGPRKVLDQLIQPPFHPISMNQIGSHVSCRGIEQPSARIITVHPDGGTALKTLEEYDRGRGMVSFGKNGTYPHRECLVIRMLYTNHPERTIMYRFEENPTGKVFVFMTDHENMDTLPLGLRHHLQNADLLVMDSQYSRAGYEMTTAGYGHGTPDFCVRTAVSVNAKLLGLTHHDPLSSDDDVDQIHQEALRALDKNPGGPHRAERIFVCRDLQSVVL